MEALQNILDNTTLPFLTAFILGLMTAVSPCPLATNITAMAYISKDITNKRKVFFNGLIYTLGRSITYTLIGVLFYFGASKFMIAGFLQKYGERALGPILIIIGLFMLDVIKLQIPGAEKFLAKKEQTSITGFWGVLLLGIVFALGFCPYSGVLYFGMLIPMTISSASGLYLPVIFALGTGLPVIVFAWIIAYTLEGIGSVYNSVKTFEKWFRRVAAGVFIIAGIYYLQYLFI